MDYDDDREFDENSTRFSGPSSSHVPVPEKLPRYVPPIGVTLPVIADSEEPQPEPSAGEPTISEIAGSDPDCDPYTAKLRRELREQKDLHDREMETYQKHAQALRVRLNATISQDRMQLQSIAAQHGELSMNRVPKCSCIT